MGMLELVQKREELRRQMVARNGSTATVNRREDLPFQPGVGGGDSRHGETSTYSAPYFPEDIWRHIHSLMSMRAAARAACISHAFLCSWRCRPNLTLDCETLCSFRCRRFFGSAVDNILRNHSGIGLKKLKFDVRYCCGTFRYNSWLQVAVKPGIEELNLRLRLKDNFPCSLLSDGVRNSIRCLELAACAFHPTVELGLLRSLTSLCLFAVYITGDELECLLYNSLALERLELEACEDIIFLKIPCVLQQFSCLRVIDCLMLQVIECKAPNLLSIDLYRHKIKLSFREPLQMMKLPMFHSNVVCYARAELPSLVPYLETLEIFSATEVVNTPMLPTKFLYLKHLTIQILDRYRPYDYFSLVSFIDASPSLETLLLEASQVDMKHESVFGAASCLSQLPEHRHDCLKSVKIRGFSSAKSLVELTCYIVKNAVTLERLVLSTLCNWGRCRDENNPRPCSSISMAELEEAFRAVTAIRMYIKDKVPATVKLTVVEPCTWCHSIG